MTLGQWLDQLGATAKDPVSIFYHFTTQEWVAYHGNQCIGRTTELEDKVEVLEHLH